MHLVTFDHGGGFGHVLVAAVGARPDDHLVDRHVTRLGDRPRVAGQVREGHGGHDARGIDLVDLGVGGVGIRLVLGPQALGAALHVGAGHVVHGDDAALTARLDGHVADGHSARHVERGDGVAGELHGLIERAVHADHPDDVEDDVFGTHTGLERAGDVELEALGHLEPGATGGHAHCRVGGAHAGGKRAQRAVGAGVAVGADDHVARAHHALLGEKRVLHTHAAHLVVVRDLLRPGEHAHQLGLLGALDVLVGRVVVGNERHLGRVPDAFHADLGKLTDGDGCRHVVGEHQVQIALDELTGGDFLEARVGGEYLLSDGHRTGHGSLHLWCVKRVRAFYAIRKRSTTHPTFGGLRRCPLVA